MFEKAMVDGNERINIQCIGIGLFPTLGDTSFPEGLYCIAGNNH